MQQFSSSIQKETAGGIALTVLGIILILSATGFAVVDVIAASQSMSFGGGGNF